MKKFRLSNKKIITEHDFRKEARETMKQLHPELSKDFWRTHYVHHIDLNPFNSELNNLEIVDRREHQRHHAWIKKNTKTDNRRSNI